MLGLRASTAFALADLVLACIACLHEYARNATRNATFWGHIDSEQAEFLEKAAMIFSEMSLFDLRKRKPPTENVSGFY